METISWNDFEKIVLCVGTIIEVDDFTEARNPAYKLKVDLGEELGVKCSSAQITDLYEKEELLNKQVICVVNFEPKRIAGYKSEVLVTGVYRSDKAVVLAVPDQNVENGVRLG